MEPAVRSPGIESAIITDRVRHVAFGLPNPQNSRQPNGIWPSKTLPRGTEFLDAETGGQPRSEAAVSAQPLLRAVDFAVEPSQPMVSAAAVSTMGSTTGADLRSVHLQSD